VIDVSSSLKFIKVSSKEEEEELKLGNKVMAFAEQLK